MGGVRPVGEAIWDSGSLRLDELGPECPVQRPQPGPKKLRPVTVLKKE